MSRVPAVWRHAARAVGPTAICLSAYYFVRLRHQIESPNPAVNRNSDVRAKAAFVRELLARGFESAEGHTDAR